MAGRTVFYAAVGPELRLYDLDVETASLNQAGSVTLPANVQYVAPHLSNRWLYVTSSNGGPGAIAGDTHLLTAFRVDPATGALKQHGAHVPLTRRPIHITTDAMSQHALVAYNLPSALTVHRIEEDGSIGAQVEQPDGLDAGIFAHQVRVSPSGTFAILVTRGNDAADGKPEEPGALKVFRYRDGLLTDGVSVAPGGGYGFGPRHIDFHPSKPWIYVSLERQNRICLFTYDGETLSPEPVFSAPTLMEPGNVRPRQLASTIHVHPNGRFVYGAERADATSLIDGQHVFTGGENTIVVYAIDPQTGEPSLIQNEPTRGMHPRTFSIDPTGRVLIVGNKSPLTVPDGSSTRVVPASLDVFRIGGDGRLTYVRKYDIDVGANSMFWTGMHALPLED